MNFTTGGDARRGGVILGVLHKQRDHWLHFFDHILHFSQCLVQPRILLPLLLQVRLCLVELVVQLCRARALCREREEARRLVGFVPLLHTERLLLSFVES